MSLLGSGVKFGGLAVAYAAIFAIATRGASVSTSLKDPNLVYALTRAGRTVLDPSNNSQASQNPQTQAQAAQTPPPPGAGATMDHVA